MTLSSNALCAKAKAMYGGRLSQEEYLDLVRKQSIGDVISYLKAQTSYARAFNEINVRHAHRQQVEDCLNSEYYRRCARLMKFADQSNQEFYMFEIVGVEIDLIMNKMYSLKAKQKISFDLSVPEYLAHKTSFNVYGLINIESFSDLVKYLQKTKYYKILKDIDFQFSVDLNDIYIQFQKMYYENIISIIKSHFKGKVQKDLLNILYTSIELKNITKIYRYKEYFHESEEQMKKSLFLEYSRLPKNMIDKLLKAASSKDVLSILANSPYHLYFDEKEYTYIEYCVEKIKYNIARRYMRFSNSAPLVYMTYCILQRIEIDNLKHIVEGIRYNQDASKIEANLIYA